MVENVRRVGRERDIVPARSSLVQAARSAAAAALPRSTLGPIPITLLTRMFKLTFDGPVPRPKGMIFSLVPNGSVSRQPNCVGTTSASLQLAANVGRALNWLFLVRSLPVVTL